MKNKVKLTLLSLFSVCMFSAGGVAVVASAQTSTPETNVVPFEVSFGGASIRYGEEKDDGIRFSVKMSKDVWDTYNDSIEETSMAIYNGTTWGAPIDTTTDWYTVDEMGNYAAENFVAYQTTVCLYGDFDASMDFQVQAYTKFADEANERAVAFEEKRSFNYVAVDAVKKNPALLDDLSKYLPSYTFTVTGGTADQDTYKYGETVTLTAETEEDFLWWTVNGEKIDGNTFVATEEATVAAVYKTYATDYETNFFVTGNSKAEAVSSLSAKEGYNFDNIQLNYAGTGTATVIYNPNDELYKDYTYTANIYWELASKVQSANGTITSADVMTGATTNNGYAGMDWLKWNVPETVEYTTKFTQNDTIRITGGESESKMVLLAWKTNVVADYENSVANAYPRFYVNANQINSAAYLRWGANGVESKIASGMNIIEFTDATVVDKGDHNCYWAMYHNAFEFANPIGTIGLVDASGNAINWQGKGPNDFTVNDNYYWAYVLPIYTGGTAYDMTITLSMNDGSQPQANYATDYAANFFVTGDDEAAAKAAFAAKYPAYTLGDVTLTQGRATSATVSYNPNAAIYDTYSYTANIYWEKASAVQSANAAADQYSVGTLMFGEFDNASTLFTETSYDGMTILKDYTVHSQRSTTFVENDTIRITGSGSGWVYVVFNTNVDADTDWGYANKANVLPRFYVQASKGVKDHIYRCPCGTWKYAQGSISILEYDTDDHNPNGDCMWAPMFAWTSYCMQGGWGYAATYTNDGYKSNGYGYTDPAYWDDGKWSFAIPLRVSGDYDFTVTLAMVQ